MSGEHAWRDIINSIARVGHGLGILENSEVQSVSLEEAGQKWMGGNAILTELVFCSK